MLAGIIDQEIFLRFYISFPYVALETPGETELMLSRWELVVKSNLHRKMTRVTAH